jgi:hypothetical protein
VSNHDYSLFGLKVSSELELPELFLDESHAAADVTIGRDRIVGEWAAGLHEHDGVLVLVIPEVARFRIAEGTSITIDPEPGVPERNVRLFLLGSAFGALLHQRGLLPLHANAVEIDGRAVAFMGESGAGKSTLAAWFHDHGHRVVADDVCVVRFDDNGAMVSPGIPRLRLWREALAVTGRHADDYEPSYSGDPGFDKFDVPATAGFGRDSLRLRSVVILDVGDEMEIEPLQGVAATEAIFNHTYRGQMVAQARNASVHWQACVRLVREVPIFRWRRVSGFDQVDWQIEKLLKRLDDDATQP